jgi:hypothetical protein
MQDWQEPTRWAVLVGAAVGVALLALVVVLATALVRSRRATVAAVRQVTAHAADLQARLDELERRWAAGERTRTPAGVGGVPGPEFVITALGSAGQLDDEPAPAAPPQVGGALFADLVLRESVVKAASLAYGVRRALDPQTRNRIRFEMRREVKRARKERRAEVRAARRLVRGRARAATAPLDDAGTAA